MKSGIKNWYGNLYFLPAKPSLLARLLYNYIRTAITGDACLRVVTVALSYECQFFCDHCSANDLRLKKQKEACLTLDDFARLFREAERCGSINIHFTGGEPLLYKNLYTVASLVNGSRNIISFATNGLLLSSEARKLKKAKFDLAIVSIDSPYADIHDALRNYKGAYREAWEGVDAALDAGLKVMVAMVATPLNLHNGEIDEQIRLCRRRKIPLQLLPARNVGKWENKEEVTLSEKDWQTFYRYVSEPDVRWDGRSSYFSARCLAGCQRLYIDPTGDVFPCDFIQQSFGNIREESIMDIRKLILKSEPFNHTSANCLSAFNPQHTEQREC